jgi:RNA polymerase sigma-70 factor (ECF subfamily)
MSPSRSSDHLLVQRVRAGEELARTELVDLFLNDVFRMCLGMLGNTHDAEDAAQDAFIRVFRFLHHWDGRPLKPWILTIAANVCRNQRAASRLAVALPIELADRPLAPPPAVALEGAIQEGLQSLREEYRLVLVLHHQLNQPVEKVGQILQKPLGTVKTWLSRGRKALWRWLVAGGHVPLGATSSGDPLPEEPFGFEPVKEA